MKAIESVLKEQVQASKLVEMARMSLEHTPEAQSLRHQWLKQTHGALDEEDGLGFELALHQSRRMNR